jgi:hypothetical protein
VISVTRSEFTQRQGPPVAGAGFTRALVLIALALVAGFVAWKVEPPTPDVSGPASIRDMQITTDLDEYVEVDFSRANDGGTVVHIMSVGHVMPTPGNPAVGGLADPDKAKPLTVTFTVPNGTWPGKTCAPRAKCSPKEPGLETAHFSVPIGDGAMSTYSAGMTAEIPFLGAGKYGYNANASGNLASVSVPSARFSYPTGGTKPNLEFSYHLQNAEDYEWQASSPPLVSPSSVGWDLPGGVSSPSFLATGTDPKATHSEDSLRFFSAALVGVSGGFLVEGFVALIRAGQVRRRANLSPDVAI